MGPFSHLVLSLIVGTGFVASKKPYGKLTTFHRGDTIELKCNADVAGVRPSILTVALVELSLLTEDGQGQEDLAILRHKQGIVPSSSNVNMRFLSRGWRIKHPADFNPDEDLQENLASRSRMVVTATKDNATCEDNGLYQCKVQYFIMAGNIGTPDIATKTFLFASLGKFLIGRIIVMSPTRAGPGQLVDDDEVTLTCKAEGPDNFYVMWQWMCANYSALIPKSSLQSEKPVLDPDQTCQVYLYTTRLTFRVQDDYDRCFARCIFGNEEDAMFVERNSSLYRLIVVNASVAKAWHTPFDPRRGFRTAMTYLIVTFSILLLIMFGILLLIYELFCKRGNRVCVSKRPVEGVDTVGISNVTI